MENKIDAKRGIGLRLISKNTLIKYNGRFTLVNYSNELIPLNVLKDSNSYSTTVLLAPLPTTEYPNGRTICDMSNDQKYDLRGYFINIDRIFSDNPWCDIIVIDDCSIEQGFLFERGKIDWGNYYEYGYGYDRAFYEYSVISVSEEYKTLKVLGASPKISSVRSDPDLEHKKDLKGGEIQ